MTDNEIIKALECCAVVPAGGCDKAKCPMIVECLIDRKALEKQALSLINRQKAEIAVLKREIPERKYGCCVRVKNGLIYTHTLDDYDRLIGDISAEAIKEFAERLKGKGCYITAWSTKNSDCLIDDKDVDNLVKERVGDDK